MEEENVINRTEPNLISVSIICNTYNHSKFIRDAIEGFLMQKTSFSIEILIHDDASTDNTAKIIKEYELKYPELIKPIYQKENQYSKNKSVIKKLQYSRALGKYIALCEGDDYWTDPYKLQKQVDFLEENPDYSLAVGGFKEYEVKTNKEADIIIIPRSVKSKGKGYSFTLDDTKNDWITKVLTAVFRSDKSMFTELLKYKYSRDINLFYHILKNGKGFYFKEVFGVYRIHEDGVFSMRKGKDNKTAAYIICKELYEKNKDNYTRYMNIRFTLALLNFNLFNRYPGNTFKSKLQLFKEALILIHTVKEVRFLITLFIPTKIKTKLEKKLESWKQSPAY